MSPNYKLTKAIKGRMISTITSAGEVMTIAFSDGSKMTVKTAGTSDSPPVGGTVKGVRQAGTELAIDLQDHGALTLHTVESTSCVMLRDKNGVMEYAD